MQNINSIPLRLYLPWFICFLYLFTVIVIMGMLYRDLASSIDRVSMNQVKQVSAQLQREMQNDLFQGKIQDAKRALIARSTDLQVLQLFATGEDGRIFIALDEELVDAYPKNVSQRYAEVAQGLDIQERAPKVIHFHDDRLIASIYPLEIATIGSDPTNARFGRLYLEYDLTPLYSELEKALTGRIITIALFMLMIALILYWFLKHFVTKPLSHLAIFADQIALGADTKLSIPEQSSGEIVNLARSLEVMNSRLNQRTNKLKEEVSEIKKKVDLDALTGLPNRRLASKELDKFIVKARHDETSVAVLFIDLDNFKLVNDTFGHLRGDKFLQEVARKLEKVTRMVDVVSRLGGDEFAVIVPGVHAKEEIHNLAKRIVESLLESFHDDAEAADVSASIGISMFPDHGGDGANLFRAADEAMYVAKRRGKNNYVFFDDVVSSSTDADKKL